MSEDFFADGNSDLDQFTDRIQQLLGKVWGSDWGIFTDEDPTGNVPEETPLPHITYNLVERVISEQLKSVKPHLFSTTPDPDNPGQNILTYRQFFDCQIDFVTYASTRRMATKVAQRFEEFMITYTGFFKDKGVSEIVFQKEAAPGVISKYRQDIPHRTIRYLVRIERIHSVRSAHLKDLEVSVQAEIEGATPTEIVPDIQQVGIGPSDNFGDLLNQHFPR